MASTFSETATQHEADPLGQLRMEAGVGSRGMFAEDLGTHHQHTQEARHGFSAPTYLF